MAQQNLVLDINVKDEITRIARDRATVIARLDRAAKTLYWKDADLQEAYHKSVDAFLVTEKIRIETVLLEGQTPDQVPANAPGAPEQHFMQGDCTPGFVEWLLKWKPVDFQNRFGVYLRPLKAGEAQPKDPRDLWLRADVIRTDSRPLPETKGGEYLATRFKMKNQIVARRKTHITFEKKEIFKGDEPKDQVIPFDDPYTPDKLDRMEKRGEIEIVYKRHAAASAGSIF